MSQFIGFRPSNIKSVSLVDSKSAGCHPAPKDTPIKKKNSERIRLAVFHVDCLFIYRNMDSALSAAVLSAWLVAAASARIRVLDRSLHIERQRYVLRASPRIC